MLTEEQKGDLERLQSQSLKIIFGFDNSYAKVLELSGLEPLEDRREAAIAKFAKKCTESQYHHWFPLNERGGRTRSSLKYREDYARCDRLRNSPIFYMRRILNRNEETD
jgi:hypothetical protein